MLFSHKKKKWSSDPCYNRNGPWKHCAKWKNPGTQKPRIVWFHLYEMAIKGKSIEVESRLPVGRGWRKGKMGNDS